MRSRKPTAISDLLDQVVSRLGIRSSLDEARVIESWAELSGPSIVAVTESVWFRRGKLFVKITSSTWRQELHMQRQAWRDRINGHLGADLVKEVVFR